MPEAVTSSLGPLARPEPCIWRKSTSLTRQAVSVQTGVRVPAGKSSSSALRILRGLRRFQGPREPQIHCCLEGEGIEIDGNAETWVGADGRRMRDLTNRSDVLLSPPMLYRDPQSASGKKGILTGRYQGPSTPADAHNRLRSISRPGALCVQLDVQDTVEGTVRFLADMPVTATQEQFALAGLEVGKSIVEALVVIKEPALTQPFFGGPSIDLQWMYIESYCRRQGISLDVNKMRSRSGEAPEDPFQTWDSLQVTCEWIQLSGRPETRFPSTDGTLKTRPIPHEITPDIVAANPDQYVGQDVIWKGKLIRFCSYNNETHMRVRLEKSGSGFVREFEAFVPSGDFVGQLADYQTDADGGFGAGDAVTVTGLVRLTGDAKCRLSPIATRVPLIELLEIVRDETDSSRAAVGKTRTQESFARNRQLDTLSRLIRQPPLPGTQVEFEGEFADYDNSNGLVKVRSSKRAYDNAVQVAFPKSGRVDFLDYRSDDVVKVEAAVSEKSTINQLVLDGKRIVRVNAPHSEVTDAGRPVRPFDLSSEKDVWSRSSRQPADNLGLSIKMAGRVKQVRRGLGEYEISVEWLFYGAAPPNEIDLKCRQSPSADELLRTLRPGEDVVFEIKVAVDAKKKLAPRLLWIARAAVPERKIVVSR